MLIDARTCVQSKKPAAIGVTAPKPGFVEPALATSIEKVRSGERCRAPQYAGVNSLAKP
jgi:hypothetical protein